LYSSIEFRKVEVLNTIADEIGDEEMIGAPKPKRARSSMRKRRKSKSKSNSYSFIRN
jgi:hypothetical protein